MTTPPFQLAEPVVRDVPAFTGLTAAARLALPQIPIFAEQASTDLMRLADAHRLPLVAAPVFIYTGPGTGGHDLVTLQIALPVPPEAEFSSPDERYALKTFDAFHCLGFLYRGPITHLGDAYPIAMNELRARGHTPMEQSREVYQRWIAYDSPDNQVEIQFGIAAK